MNKVSSEKLAVPQWVARYRSDSIPRGATMALFSVFQYGKSLNGGSYFQRDMSDVIGPRPQIARKSLKTAHFK